MSITCRKGNINDLPVLLEIESRSTPSLLYLDAVKDEFFDNSRGELIVAEEDGQPIGFARFSLQCDGSGWLEILRVDPAHQKKGCGAVIWKRFIELCEIYKVPYVRMYTGLSNYASRVLGERNGLHVAYQTREGTLMLENAPDVTAPDGFSLSDCHHCAEAAISPYVEGYHGYFCMNRTFYGLTQPLYKQLVSDGYVWEKDVCGWMSEQCPETKEILSLIDVCVDGPFIEALKNISLQFRGSENQRLIDVSKTLQTGEVVLWTE